MTPDLEAVRAAAEHVATKCRGINPHVDALADFALWITDPSWLAVSELVREPPDVRVAAERDREGRLAFVVTGIWTELPPIRTLGGLRLARLALGGKQ